MEKQLDLGFDNMVVFTAVVEAGGFTAAAQRLGLRKSSVSRRVAQLEQRLGVRLLHRTTRTMRVTHLGREYYRHCVRAIAEVQEAEQVVVQARANLRGDLRITTTQPVAESLLVPVVAAFLDQYPEVQIEVQTSTQTADLIEHGFDLAIRVGPIAGSTSLKTRPLGRARICYCASVGYLQKRSPPQTPADLRTHDCVVISNDGHIAWPFVGPKGRLSIVVRGRLRTSSFGLAYQAIHRGCGIARLPHSLVAADIEHGRLVPVLADYTPPAIQIQAIYPGRRTTSPILDRFLDVLEAHGANNTLMS